MSGTSDRDGEHEGEPAVPLKTWIAVGGALLGAFMAVLDISITNTSLPYIEGGIGTGGVYGTWISTAYLIGEIIVIPLTDFMSRVFSLRRYLLANVALFLLFSVLCGQAHSLGEIIVFRALQGFSGGVMIPLAFTIIISMLPPSKRAAGFAGFAVTATFAPRSARRSAAISPTIMAGPTASTSISSPAWSCSARSHTACRGRRCSSGCCAGATGAASR